MAVKLAEAYVEITARMDKLNAQLNTSKSTVMQWATGLATALGGVAIFSKLEQAASAFAKASVESAKVVSAMNTALATAGHGSEIDRFDKLSESFKALGKDDEPIKRVITQIANLGRVSVADLERATATAVGLSEVLGIELPEATKVTLRAMQGNFALLERMGFSFGEGATEAQKAQMYFEAAGRGIEQAAARATSFLGILERVNNQIGDIFESFGGTLAQGEGNNLAELQARLQELNRMRDQDLQANPGSPNYKIDSDIENIQAAIMAANEKLRANRAAAKQSAEAGDGRKWAIGAVASVRDALDSALRNGFRSANAGIDSATGYLKSTGFDDPVARDARLQRAYDRALQHASDMMDRLPGAENAVASIRARIADYGMGEGRAFGQQLYNRDTFSGAPTGAIARIQLPNFGGMTASVDVPRDMLKELRSAVAELKNIKNELQALGVAP